MILLEEEEMLGLRIVALARAGALSAFSCESCDEERQKTRNCNGDQSNTPVFYHQLLGEFYACPLNFVSPAIHDFVDRYDYLEKYPSAAPQYEEVNPRYWAAVKFYEDFKCKLDKAGESKSPGGDGDKLSKMRALAGRKK